LRSVTQVWVVHSGKFQLYFDKKSDAVWLMAQQWFLDNLPEGTVLMVSPGYRVVELEPPQLEYHK